MEGGRGPAAVRRRRAAGGRVGGDRDDPVPHGAGPERDAGVRAARGGELRISIFFFFFAMKANLLKFYPNMTRPDMY